MARKVKTFLYVFVHSLIPEVSYYKKILRTHFYFSLKYYISLIIAVNVVFLLFASVKLNPMRISSILTSLTKSLHTYPNKLIIEIKDGKLTTTYNRPYFLWLDYEGKKYLLLTIDESAPTQKISDYHSYMLLTSHYAVEKNFNLGGKTTLHALKNFKDQKITKNTIQEVETTFATIIRFLPIVYIIAIAFLLIFLPVLSFVVTSLYILITSTVLYIIIKYVGKRSAHFQKILQVSFHAITLPLIADYSLIALNLGSRPTPLLFLFLVLIFISGGVYEAYLDPDQK